MYNLRRLRMEGTTTAILDKKHRKYNSIYPTNKKAGKFLNYSKSLKKIKPCSNNTR